MKLKKFSLKRPGRIASYLYVVLILLSLFSVATYTWFSLSRTPEVNDMALYVNSPTGMQLSVDPLADDWTLQVDFSKMTGTECPLRPVTWSDSEKRFYAANYGIDGRMTGIWEPLTDSRNANKDNADGYYMMGTVYARCDQRVTVSLTPAVEVEEGVKGSGTFVMGSPIWNAAELRHENGGKGAEMSIRIGFLIEKTDLKGEPTEGESVFYIYEPNNDRHIDGSTGYVDTASIDMTQTLVEQDRLIGQTMNSWTESDPVEKNVVVRTLGEFTSDTELFELVPDELAKITIYVWLEGQDIDCTNVIGQEARILASIQFATESKGQSGLTPIE